MIWSGFKNDKIDNGTILDLNKTRKICLAGRKFLSREKKKGCFVMRTIEKETSGFLASARAVITMKPETLDGFMDEHNRELKEMRYSAEDAGFKAAKKTQESIPMCFPLPMEALQFEFSKQGDDKMEIRCHIHTKKERTSAGMEALSAAGMAAFVLKDMCNHIDQGMNISNVEVIK